MPRGVKNTENTAPASKTEKVTRPRLSAAEKAQKDVDVAQKKYDAVATKLRTARSEAAKLDEEAKELKVLLDYYKSSPFLPKTEDPDAPAVLTSVDDADPLDDESEDDAAPEPLTDAPADLPGADQLGDAEADVESGEVVATDAQPAEDNADDPFAQYNS